MNGPTNSWFQSSETGFGPLSSRTIRKCVLFSATKFVVILQQLYQTNVHLLGTISPVKMCDWKHTSWNICMQQVCHHKPFLKTWILGFADHQIQYSGRHFPLAHPGNMSGQLVERELCPSPQILSPLLVRRKVKVARSCPTLCDPMDCSPPGSSVHGDPPGKNTGVGCHALLQGFS